MNNEAVLRLFDTYADDAFRLAYTYLGSRPDAEDVVQDVFVKLIRSDITITKGKEKSYILTMTANKCRDFLKSADVVFKAPFDDAVEAGSDIEIDEDDTEMYEAVSELPILDIAPSAVSMRLTRAKEILRKRFMGGSSYAG